jgi:hypothetical protein
MKLFATAWPPTRSCGVSVVWALLIGFVLQLLVPAVFVALGSSNGALFAMYPGLLPILWATRGWFESLTLMGVVVLCGINTVSYAILTFVAIRLCKVLNDLRGSCQG